MDMDNYVVIDGLGAIRGLKGNGKNEMKIKFLEKEEKERNKIHKHVYTK